MRDRLLEELSKLTDISVSYNERKDVTVTIGKTGAGPKILSGKVQSKIGITDNGGTIQVLMGAGTSNTPTNQVSGGILAGVVDSYALIGDTNRDIDNLAVLISETINEQHKQGLTLDGKQGENIFVNMFLKFPSALDFSSSYLKTSFNLSGDSFFRYRLTLGINYKYNNFHYSLY